MTTTQISKHQMFDYVSKREFNDFVEEMRDFRDVTETRFESIDKRLNIIDRKFDDLKEVFRVHTGALLEQFREDLKVGLEYIQNIDNKGY